MLSARAVDGSADTSNESSTKSAVVGVIIAAAVLVCATVLLGVWKKRRSRRAFEALPTSQRRARDDLQSTDSAVPWLSSRPSNDNSSFSSSHRTSHTPSSSLNTARLSTFNPSHTADDADVQLLPPRTSFLAPEPPSPTYSPVVPEGHTSSGTPRASEDDVGGLAATETTAEGPTRTLSARRDRPELALATRANSTVSGATNGTAPPPYSPQVIGVGSVLSPRT